MTVGLWFIIGFLVGGGAYMYHCGLHDDLCIRFGGYRGRCRRGGEYLE